MIPQERGLEGLSVYFIFLFTHNCLMERIDYIRFLGKATGFLICK
jgi:hypothetical protein